MPLLAVAISPSGGKGPRRRLAHLFRPLLYRSCGWWRVGWRVRWRVRWRAVSSKAKRRLPVPAATPRPDRALVHNHPRTPDGDLRRFDRAPPSRAWPGLTRYPRTACRRLMWLPRQAIGGRAMSPAMRSPAPCCSAPSSPAPCQAMIQSAPRVVNATSTPDDEHASGPFCVETNALAHACVRQMHAYASACQCGNESDSIQTRREKHT